ncbi:MAG: purine-nucleoside phosphorylase [Chloroflexi bacterium]|nr:purine-nucleoside phosphorylase [Chloroflexota bacterium]MBU1660703.1 purine-nucleoside phosphorylase [Chloroflexota bacterium]
MEKYFTLEEIDHVAQAVRDRIACQPQAAMILGSGLGSLAEAVENPTVIPYGELPNWPVSTVFGHEGSLVVGKLEGQDIIMMQGRVHYYEGYSMNQVTLPIRVMQRLGVEFLIVTNAAGAVNPEFDPGDLMLITDHLNLIGMAGHNPLRGPNLDELGSRFPDMGRAYDRELGNMARQVAAENKILLREGVYVGLAGPSFETPADLRFLRAIGVDAVGMSTVPEVTVAHHAGQRVLGISGISNKANLDGDTFTTHEEVLEAGKLMVPNLTSIVRGVLQRI